MLKTNKVAIFSDLHLGIYGNSEAWHDIAINWAEWIVSDIKKKKIKDIFFLGDFFHNRSEISVQTMHVASQIIEKFNSFNMYMIVGNHDAFYKNRSDVHSLGLIKGHKNISIIDKNTVIESFDKNILFVPWNSDLPDGKYDYIFGHFEIQNFKMNNFKICDHGMSAMEFLSEKTRMVFSGHFHNRNHKKYNEGEIHYVGNTFPMDFADSENTKGYHILDIEDGAIQFIENTVSPKFKKILVSKIKTYSSEDFKNNIIKLIIDVNLTDEQVSKIQAYISKHKPFQLNTEFYTESKTINDVVEIDSIDIMEQFKDYIKQLKLDTDKEQRVDKIIKDLYEKAKL